MPEAGEKGPTDYTDPDTIDVDEVVANITHAHKMRGDKWDDSLSWPNVTVLALANEVTALRRYLELAMADENERLRGVVGWWEDVARKHNLCIGCGSLYRPEAHVYGRSKCCPDCTHHAALFGSSPHPRG